MHKENMIVALDRNGAIGQHGKIPWHLPADMAFFKDHTKEAGIVVMGRKTWDSLQPKYRPLVDRMNVVLSTQEDFKIPDTNCLVLHSVSHFLKIFKRRKFFVIGGGEIYRLFMPYVSRIFITHVDTEMQEPDTFFPALDSEWKYHIVKKHEADEKHLFPFVIKSYTRHPRSLV